MAFRPLEFGYGGFRLIAHDGRAALRVRAIAQEVLEGERLAFDRVVMLAFRDPARPSVPIGPPWLQEAAQDVTRRPAHDF
jgi:hypothetical protein